MARVEALEDVLLRAAEWGAVFPIVRNTAPSSARAEIRMRPPG